MLLAGTREDCRTGIKFLERVPGAVSLSVMGIETLNNAAWAAGFAMAADDFWRGKA